jgi:hypothetical protein
MQTPEKKIQPGSGKSEVGRFSTKLSNEGKQIVAYWKILFQTHTVTLSTPLWLLAGSWRILSSNVFFS